MRLSTAQHAIEHGTAYPRFGFLVILTPRTQLPPNELLVMAYVSFND